MYLLALAASLASDATASDPLNLRGKEGDHHVDERWSLEPVDWSLYADGTWTHEHHRPSLCTSYYNEGEWLLEHDGSMTIPGPGDDFRGRLQRGGALLRLPSSWDGYTPVWAMQRPAAKPLLYPMLFGVSADEHWLEAHLYEDGQCLYLEYRLDRSVHEEGRCDGYVGADDDDCTWTRDPATGLPVLSVLGVEYPTTPGSELGCLTLTTPEREIPVCVY